MGYTSGLVICKTWFYLLPAARLVNGWERFLLGIRLLAFGYVLGTMIYLKQPLKPVNHGTLYSTLLETMDIKEPWDDDVLISHLFLGHNHFLFYLLPYFLAAGRYKRSFTCYSLSINRESSLKIFICVRKGTSIFVNT